MPNSPVARASICVGSIASVLVVLVAVGAFPGAVHLAPMFHTVVVGLMAAVSLVAALVIFRAAWQRMDIRAALVCSGFTAFAGMMIIHAAATPGGLVFHAGHHQQTVAYAGVMSVPIAALLIGAAMVAPSRLEHSRRPILLVQAIVIAAVGAFAAVGLLKPALLPTYALMQPPVSLYVLVPTCVVFALAAWRAYHTARMTRRSSDAAVFAGVAILSMSIITYVTSVPFSFQFWVGHALELIGFIALAVGVAVDVRRPLSVWRLNHQVDGQRFLSSSEQLLGGHVHALTVTLAQVDPHTWEHSRRVAEYAVAVGEELGLPWTTVRQLAVAGLVHDIGKLQVPREVLDKPGKLDAAEFDLIKRHPEWGAELLAHLRGFTRELPIVRGHHEKLSGRGYPDGLTQDQIATETRIMTVCDVYDALTDSRSYKEPWPPERAVALLREESGSAFDAEIVAALERVLRRRGIAVESTGEATGSLAEVISISQEASGAKPPLADAA